VRIAAVLGATHVEQVAKRLKSEGLVQMARFLLRGWWPMHWCSRC